jgi:NAD(P)-dependent dehydrogenase (short-subunit alcohol dehydrogenase family)
MIKNKFNLKGKAAIITGGAGLLADQHINAVLQNGGKVVLIDINKKKLELKKKKLQKRFSKNKILIFEADIAEEEQIRKIQKYLKLKNYNIDILINNAAIDYSLNSKGNKLTKNIKLENFDVEIWKRDLNVGLLGSLICTKIFGSEMAKRNQGVIINVASDLSFISPDNRIYNKNPKKINFVKPVSYSVVKHGIIGLTRYTAAYWANKKVRCNAIAPGGITNNQSKSFLKKISQLIPLGRLAYKNEYEASILYLISDASSYMNGAVLTIDGGRTVL